MNRFALCVIAVLCILPGAVFAADKLNPPLTGDMLKLQVLDPPRKLPEVMLSKLPDGLSYFSEYKTSVVVLNLWATWCPPCVEELPSLNALAHAMGSDDFKVVAVSVEKDNPDVVQKFMEDNKLDKLQPFVDVNGSLQSLDVLREISGIPVTLILDRQMRIRAVYPGNADWNGRSARAVLEYYIKNLPPIGSE